jgi:hypothetical protein
VLSRPCALCHIVLWIGLWLTILSCSKARRSRLHFSQTPAPLSLVILDRELISSAAALETAIMASGFKVIRNGGDEVTRSAGYDAELQAVSEGPYSDTFAYRYCQDISAYCDVDNCKQATFSSLTSRGPSSSRSSPKFEYHRIIVC